ncbi:MAG TPA: OB-fold domain-containing protein [Acidimicrobiales bacterium]|nr:OB-fold domain-containing protein [Acidimicrobiales bacterium]
MTSTEPPPGRMEPPVTPTSEPFWEATKQRQLVLQWCTECERAIFFPRDNCPVCLGSSLDWRPASGRGVVHSVTVETSSPNPAIAGGDPYAVALVDLEEGVRMMSNIVGCPPGEVAVGQAVQVTWAQLSDGRHLPQFERRE